MVLPCIVVMTGADGAKKKKGKKKHLQTDDETSVSSQSDCLIGRFGVGFVNDSDMMMHVKASSVIDRLTNRPRFVSELLQTKLLRRLMDILQMPAGRALCCTVQATQQTQQLPSLMLLSYKCST